MTTTDRTTTSRAGERGPVRSADIVEETSFGHDDALVDDELLIEDLTIDGMCGVY